MDNGQVQTQDLRYQSGALVNSVTCLLVDDNINVIEIGIFVDDLLVTGNSIIINISDYIS